MAEIDAPESDGIVEPRPVYLVKGDDQSVIADAVKDLVSRLVGTRDTGMVVEEYGSPGGDDLDIGTIVDALTTPPFITDRRVVVVRDAGRLVSCIDDSVPGVVLLLAGGGGTLPAALVKAVERQGEVVGASVGTGRARSQWLAERLRAGPVSLEAAAAAKLGEHMGGDVGRLRGLLDSLASAYGLGAKISVVELEPFLGQAGAVAPWDLTDAMDAGDTSGALKALDRLINAGGFHPLALMTILHRHVQAALRLDGAQARNAEEAAALLGSRGTYMAGKALDRSRRLGGARIASSVALLAQADLDVRGASALPGNVVLEVLVARLTRMPSTARGVPPKRLA